MHLYDYIQSEFIKYSENHSCEIFILYNIHIEDMHKSYIWGSYVKTSSSRGSLLKTLKATDEMIENKDFET